MARQHAWQLQWGSIQAYPPIAPDWGIINPLKEGLSACDRAGNPFAPGPSAHMMPGNPYQASSSEASAPPAGMPMYPQIIPGGPPGPQHTPSRSDPGGGEFYSQQQQQGSAPSTPMPPLQHASQVTSWLAGWLRIRRSAWESYLPLSTSPGVPAVLLCVGGL